MSAELWPWVVLLLLGALHGLNPGMGWLFAVALGMQQGDGRAVWRALLPLTAGHALAIAFAVGVAAVAGLVLPADVVRRAVVVLLLALGVRQLWRHRHPRGAGMRVGARELVAWSFLIATAHGAGLMSVPFAAQAGAMNQPAEAHAAMSHQAHGPAAAAMNAPSLRAVAATLAHTAGYVLVAGVLAMLVYRRAGLGFLRRAWINLDVVWGATLVVTAGAILLI